MKEVLISVDEMQLDLISDFVDKLINELEYNDSGLDDEEEIYASAISLSDKISACYEELGGNE